MDEQTQDDAPPRSPAKDDPIEKFRTWLGEAEAKEISNPNAMALATANAAGRPSVRMVLLKDVDDQGFVFYTNLESRKGGELQENPFAALCFYWKTLERQVRVEGPIKPVEAAEADAYFASRHRSSRIGAWASKQSRPMKTRFDLEKRVAEFTARFHVGAVPRPEFWSGFRVVPERIEFWTEGAFRLHERIVYHCTDSGWETERLFP
ncbi:MAG: pyridoxamine 5'-phosphate oxidase [Rhodospirillales bacterium CG15_BIG_FIL_POST_REV_8_21_14_020_66_15]|nr:MAG: pyridoxamine 5'-phosphate oxidase [Rhodospirillales bacterium CG15_BIG_FIL_POST_REV_8_21_14_020_66_15]